MNERVWFAKRFAYWQKLEALLKQKRLDRLPEKDLRWLLRSYPYHLSDTVRSRSYPGLSHLAPYLGQLLYRLHTRLYTRPPARLADILTHVWVTFPRCVRRNLGLILLAACILFAGVFLAMWTVHQDPETAAYFMPQQVIDQLAEGKLWMDGESGAPHQSAFLLTNNIKVAIMAFAFGVFFALGTLLLLFYNGLQALGGPLQLAMEYGIGHRLLAFILPHGVIELSCIFFAGAAGMKIGFSLLFPGDRHRWDAARRAVPDAMTLITGCIPLLIVAGCIEGMISLNQAIGLLPRLLIALASILFLLVYLGLGGRSSARSSSSKIS
ncbi:MAG: stage II sporulation protein M [Candidatus Melainabacteria bacterium]|nr:stage II sporulation protein M [Candidatus Melainabacteria bacterium]